jgi:hypothetical protein
MEQHAISAPEYFITKTEALRRHWRRDARNRQSAGLCRKSNAGAWAQSQDIQLIYRALPSQQYGHSTNRGVSNKQETSHVQEFRDRAQRRGRPRDGARLRELRPAEPAGMVARLRNVKVGQALRRRR